MFKKGYIYNQEKWDLLEKEKEEVQEEQKIKEEQLQKELQALKKELNRVEDELILAKEGRENKTNWNVGDIVIIDEERLKKEVGWAKAKELLGNNLYRFYQIEEKMIINKEKKEVIFLLRNVLTEEGFWADGIICSEKLEKEKKPYTLEMFMLEYKKEKLIEQGYPINTWEKGDLLYRLSYSQNLCLYNGNIDTLIARGFHDENTMVSIKEKQRFDKWYENKWLEYRDWYKKQGCL